MANSKSKTEIRKAPQGVDQLFETACSLANTPSTYRQWQKWKQGRGKAFSMKNVASNPSPMV